ncbi:thiosulfate sulfurtransferase [Photobacterium aquimaris]|uniref:rhodanese-like domain-containing protein n=1 Tax=Photobacterium aquimaris TaxID=512643 RepID=UPI0007EF09FF|nr:rhodanese-like domain-containing protein [Photobacterium aquimaris]OBU15232.1 thiosulfate sulfurtransferase [Photobacterium aquimaris]PSW01760.1 sulfurtransferase [Photobacterium aquimaris]
MLIKITAIATLLLTSSTSFANPSSPLKTATFKQLAQQQAQTAPLQIIDCRNSNFYNGWPEAQQQNGGHIAGAVNIDANWLKTLDTAAFQTLLRDKHLKSDLPTYLYCSADKAQQLTTALQSQGYHSLTTIDQPLNDYHDKLIALPNFQQLVPASWLNDLITDKHPRYAPKHGYKVVEVEWGPPAKYLLDHIPGALYVNTNTIESKPWWNKVNNKALAQIIANLGIRYDTTVILYARNNMSAARFANFLMYAGVKDVRLLNGGWTAWSDADYPTEHLPNYNKTPVAFGKTIPANPQYLIDTAQVKALLKKPISQQSVVSVRTWPEYIGETSGYDYIKPKGRIEGAKWGHAGSDSYHMQDYLNPDQTMKSGNEITAQWAQWNIKPNQDVAFFCGTGWRASEAFFFAHILGWKNISVYDGGWYQWSANKNNPIAEGTIAPASVH